MKLYPESSFEFLENDILNQYLMGGQAVVTLESPSGVKHTYLYAKPKNTNYFPDDTRFVYALHQQVQQFYIGMIEMDKFRLTQNSRFLNDTDIVKGVLYIEKLRKNQISLHKSLMKIYHEGTCARCGRRLINKESIEIGFGPKCKRKVVSYNVDQRSRQDAKYYKSNRF